MYSSFRVGIEERISNNKDEIQRSCTLVQDDEPFYFLYPYGEIALTRLFGCIDGGEFEFVARPGVSLLDCARGQLDD